MKALCNKDLFMGRGKSMFCCFSKGQTYDVITHNHGTVLDVAILLDNHEEEHMISSEKYGWYQHFTFVEDDILQPVSDTASDKAV